MEDIRMSNLKDLLIGGAVVELFYVDSIIFGGVSENGCFIHYYIYDIASNVRPIVYLFDVLLSDKVCQVNPKQFGSLYQTPQVGLGCVRTPLGYCGLVFAQLLSKPFVCFLLVCQDYFNPVNILICHIAILFIGKSTQKWQFIGSPKNRRNKSCAVKKRLSKMVLMLLKIKIEVRQKVF